MLITLATVAMSVASSPVPSDYLDAREQISPESWLECVYDQTDGSDLQLVLMDQTEVWTTDLEISTEENLPCKSWLSDPSDIVSECIRSGECYRVEHIRKALTIMGRWPNQP